MADEVTAQATIEERHLLKSLNWYDGFVIGLCQPAFLLGSLGFTLATIGAWGSILLWGISATVGLLQNFIYAETAAMFPDKPGGIALYAHEGWRSRFNLFGPIAAFGYWIGWSVVLSFVGNIVGALIVAEWFPKSGDGVDDAYFNLGFADFGLAQLIAIVVILGVWLFNVFGVKPSLAVGYVTGALLMVPLAIFIVFPYFTGDWHASQPRVRPQLGRLQRPQDRPDVALHHVLVGVRGRGMLPASPPSTTTRNATPPRPEERGGVLAVRLHLPARSGSVGSSALPATRAATTCRPWRRSRVPRRRLRRHLSHREPDPRDEHVDRGRRPRALRHRPRRHDDQVALPPEQVPRPRPRDDASTWW